MKMCAFEKFDRDMLKENCMCMCMHACMHARARACVCVCVCVCDDVCTCIQRAGEGGGERKIRNVCAEEKIRFLFQHNACLAIVICLC